MLAKKNRLTKQNDFTRTFKKGKTVIARFFVLKCVRDTASAMPAKIGFVVSTKVSKSAVVRNTIKRRMREAVRGEHKNIPAGSLCAFIMKKTAAPASSSELTADVCAALKKIA